MDEPALREVLRTADARLGPDRAIVQVALPGMRAVGTRWRAGEIDVAAEHAATAGVRDWLAGLATDVPLPPGPPVVLACAASEQHTLGLEALAALLRLRAIPALMLGANTPTLSLVRAVRTSRARAAVVTAHRAVVRRSAIDALEALDRLHVSACYAGNAFATPRSRAGVPGTYLGEDLLTAVTLVGRAAGWAPLGPVRSSGPLGR
jgi:methanogenic corrinoid protein MtbC1